MPVSLSQRLLAILQFTRIALVFTAISNAWTAATLRAGAMADPETSFLGYLNPASMAYLTLASIGLYGFGMTLNDVIDRRRDATMAADRPLPSGRLPLGAAKAICLLLLAMGLSGGVLLASTHMQTQPVIGRLTLIVTLGVAALIAFYDLAGKYLLSLGLLTLGLIRFFHAAIADPTLSMPWHPLLLLNHVAILSTVAYAWEQKRPILTRKHFVFVLGGLALIDAALLAVLVERRSIRPGGWMSVLDIGPGLIYPAAAIVGFLVAATIVRWRSRDARGAGKMLMLVGLLWLIVYDACFVVGFVGWQPALVLLALLPIAWASVKLMRAWSALVAMSEKPKYLRAD